jgi:hypothetical protein
MALAVAGIVVAGIALAWQVLTWATLRRTRLRVEPVIYYVLPTGTPPAKVGVRVTNLSDHPVEVRRVLLHLTQPDGSDATPLDTTMDIAIPARLASYRHGEDNYGDHHRTAVPVGWVERADGRWIASLPGWRFEYPAPPHLAAFTLPGVRVEHRAPRGIRRWWALARTFRERRALGS